VAAKRRRPGPALPYVPIAGIEPAAKGWVVVAGRLQGTNLAVEPPQRFGAFEDILEWKPAFEIVAVHIPIGLPDKPRRGGRTAEREARKLLGWPRAGAIAPAPVRAALTASDFDEAYEVNEGMSVVTWAQLPKIAEVNRDFGPYQQRSVFEVHPELGFYNLNRDRPLSYSKRTPEGRAERGALLEARMPGVERALATRVRGVTEAQVLDACSDLWTARRIAAKAASRLPRDPEWDSEGLRMEIWR
jgi:predicted RNase H-like nuclease